MTGSRIIRKVMWLSVYYVKKSPPCDAGSAIIKPILMKHNESSERRLGTLLPSRFESVWRAPHRSNVTRKLWWHGIFNRDVFRLFFPRPRRRLAKLGVHKYNPIVNWLCSTGSPLCSTPGFDSFCSAARKWRATSIR